MGGTYPIVLEGCRVGDALRPDLESISWRLAPGEAWAALGPSGGGRDAFAEALAGERSVAPGDGGLYRNDLRANAAIVSFEAAAALERAERYRDDSDFAEGGVSEGTSARLFIAASLPAPEAALYPRGARLEAHPAVVACGLAERADGSEGILDRGLKRLSTGECRRVLLCRALASRPALLVLVDPYEGLDAASRDTLGAMLRLLVEASVRGDAGAPAIVIADELERVPESVNRVVELADGAIRYAGTRSGYEARRAGRSPGLEQPAPAATLPGAAGREAPEASAAVEPLVELRDVTVGWSGRAVLDSLSWTVLPGEHWLVRGPNGSGKTTLLELISGDNPQAYREDVRLFGRRRGSGETVWELKARLGLASYRLHLEYRYLGESRLEDVLVSGLHDTIGLYAEAAAGERELARSWLELAGFGGRSEERFGHLSFGEQRTLLVARAAIKGPELLMLDEPCHGLDAAQRRFVLSLLARIAARGGTTMIHVTHDPGEVQGFERRVLELRPGSTPSWAVLER